MVDDYDNIKTRHIPMITSHNAFTVQRIISRATQWDNLFMHWADTVAQMSYAVRLKVGCVAVRDRRVIALGYNGTPANEDNSCEELVESNQTDDTKFMVWKDNKNWKLITKPNVIHAEDNLIRFSKENNIELTGCTLYITHSPCAQCCDKIIDAKINRIVYKTHYRDISGLTKLRDNNIIIDIHNENFY